MSNRAAIREYVNGSLWVLPMGSGLLALLVGYSVSMINVSPGSWLAPLAYQGTAGDARDLLSNVTSTVVTVIALVLGLTVVALQLSSTQFSPRLVRNFLRDRPNQLALSVFVATFAYCAAGLYTVGEADRDGAGEFPRLAVSGSIALLFASLAMVVYFADHLAHSLQVDAIGARVERDTLHVVHDRLGSTESVTPAPPPWAIRLIATESGYVQTVRPEALLAMAVKHRVTILLRVRVGEHLVAGTAVAWMWTATADEAPPDPALFRHSLHQTVRLGFERTMEQDAAFGIRQLVDMACKALSPAVNDPYTAVQAIDRLTVIFCSLAVRPLGDFVAAGPGGEAAVIVPGRRFGDYLGTMCGLIRRYGCSEPSVSLALFRLLGDCASVLPEKSDRWAELAEQADLILADATREIAQPADLVPVAASAERLRLQIEGHLSDRR